MKSRYFAPLRHFSPSLVLSVIALFVALGGGAAVAATQLDAGQLGGKPPSYYLPAKNFVSSGGEHFFGLGKTVVLGHAGHFTFTAKCSNDSGGAQSVTFGVSTNTYADLDGNGPGTGPQTIHVDSDALDSTSSNMLNPGDFAQVGSASSSTEIAGPDGQEVDVFYNDGVNWPRQHGGTIPCFAGYTGFLG
ncbi:MAG TPA: hypothetical protein VMA77_09200 [Solirubrobacteraceae bacterium]|nr:hypothetical protein [Solirubrobacteraceae bacterium]